MAIDSIINTYHTKFKTKEFADILETSDILMDIFDIDPAVKRQNMQYWSRELGMCWQRLVVDVARSHRMYGPPIRWGDDEPCDLVMGNTAIDTKYRLGSGDAGTLKKLKDYARQLKEQNMTPVMLILRPDSLQSSVDACISGGWLVYSGQDSFKFIERRCGVDLQALLCNALALKRQAQIQGLVQDPLVSTAVPVLAATPPMGSPPIAPTTLAPIQTAVRPHLPSLSGLPPMAKPLGPQEIPANAGL